MRKQVWLLGLVLLAVAGTGLASNIVVNGGFEDPDVAEAQHFPTPFTGWNPSGYGVYLVDKVVRPNIPEGNQCAQLLGLTSGSSDIYQLFTGLTPGAQYKVRYAQAQRGDDPSIPSALTVMWKYWEGGIFMGTNHVLYQQTTTETAATYTYHEFTITAQNENDYIVFFAQAVDVGGVLTDNMPNFDDISVELVPEPATLALLAAGGVLCLRRRRRK